MRAAECRAAVALVIAAAELADDDVADVVVALVYIHHLKNTLQRYYSYRRVVHLELELRLHSLPLVATVEEEELPR